LIGSDRSRKFFLLLFLLEKEERLFLEKEERIFAYCFFFFRKRRRKRTTPDSKKPPGGGGRFLAVKDGSGGTRKALPPFCLCHRPDGRDDPLRGRVVSSLAYIRQR
jgi:hypothetical protein